jgi:rRNA maturation endonuclease Nob1
MIKTIGDFDIWYKRCEHCGHDTAKSTPPPKNENKRCWKCGRGISRDYSDRALKPSFDNSRNTLTLSPSQGSNNK